MTTLKGVLEFYSETGTEGGHWAFQDEKFMHLEPPNQWWCPRCGRVWDRDKHPEEPKPSFTYWIPRDTLSKEQNPKRYAGGYMSFAAPQDGTLVDPATGIEFPVSEGPSDIDRGFTHAMNDTSRHCYDEGHEQWQSPKEQWPEGIWSYEGLHVLENGDKLAIYDKEDPTHLLWRGVINLTEHGLFTEDAFGMWINTDQIGEDREAWARLFIEQYPAELEVS